MKNFSELLDTKLELEVTINGHKSIAALRQSMSFEESSRVEIDDIEILPRYRHLAVNGVLQIDEPFYCWLHRVTGQGWLLTPYLNKNK